MATMRAPLQHYYYRGVSRQHYAAVMGGASSGASMLLAGETQGLALDFTDDHYQPTTGFYGSARIIDTGTPANNYDSSPTTTAASLLTYTSPSLKMTMGPSGTLRFGAHNLYTQSEDISHANWTKTQCTVSGTTITGAVGTIHKHISQTPAIPANAPYAIMCEAKAGTHSAIQLLNNGDAEHYGNFDLTTGVVGTAGTRTTVSITSLGDGWYRCVAEFGPGTSSTSARISLAASASATYAQATASTGTVDVRKAHCRRTPSDSTYLSTTTAARYALPLEWSTAGVLQGLLVEEARTNGIPYSDDLANAVWAKSSATAAKTATGPDGVANSASTLTATAADGTASYYATSASAARSGSVYLKRRTGSGTVSIAIGETTGSELVTNGTFTSDISGWTAYGTSTPTLSHTGSALLVTNTGATSNRGAYQQITCTAGKLYRLTGTMTASSGTVVPILLAGSSAGGSQYGSFSMVSGTAASLIFRAGVSAIFISLRDNGTDATSTLTFDDISVLEVAETTCAVDSTWQRFKIENKTMINPGLVIKLATSGDEVDVALCQVESGAFVTSPIPTTGATATRAVDNISLATSAFPWSTTVGTMFLRAIPKGVLSTTTYPVQVAQAIGANNSLIGFSAGPSRHLRAYTAAAAEVAAIDAGDCVLDQEMKSAGAWAADDFASSLNGGAVVTDTAGTVGTTQTLLAIYGGTWIVKQIMYLPRRMSNAAMQTLTT